jgi:hypothetical protein
MSKSKRYSFSVVEMGIMNPKRKGLRGGRIEVFDSKDRSDGYASYEASFFVPEEFFESFRAVWDEKQSDKMPFILWDYKEVKRNKAGFKIE